MCVAQSCCERITEAGQQVTFRGITRARLKVLRFNGTRAMRAQLEEGGEVFRTDNIVDLSLEIIFLLWFIPSDLDETYEYRNLI